MEAIQKETFFASAFLPCHHDLAKAGTRIEAIVAHPNIPNKFDYLVLPEIPKQPNNKHLSINTMRVSFKQIKKVKMIRTFSHNSSVFSDWRPDTDKVIEEAFRLDSQYLKIHKFVRDPDEAKRIKEVLRKYFVPLKNQFLQLAANPKFFPSICWFDFILQANEWKIIDKHNLTQTDIDRSFIAVNYEEVDLENNDDNSLCRYEFMELIVRLAKIKFTDKG